MVFVKCFTWKAGVLSKGRPHKQARTAPFKFFYSGDIYIIYESVDINNGAVCVAACVGVSPAKIYYSLKNNNEQMNKKSSNSLPSRLRVQRKTPISTTISRLFLTRLFVLCA